MSERDQSFRDFHEWVGRASSWLTRRGPHVHAVCFDMAGNACLNGADFMRARDNGLFPVRWMWPDQVGQIAVGNAWRPAP